MHTLPLTKAWEKVNTLRSAFLVQIAVLHAYSRNKLHKVVTSLQSLHVPRILTILACR